ncbi:hypothetical protein V6N13_040084 [Hibiscus sabdariffa]
MQAFGFLTDKVSTKVCGWNENLLSYGAREVFLKVVAQALPTSVMTCYFLPYCVLDHIVGVMCNYWWSGCSSRRGWLMIAWKKFCTPKRAGGLAFCELHQFNVALLGKQVWGLLVDRQSLVSRVLASKYFPHTTVLDAHLGDRPSAIWRSIHKAMMALRDGFFWQGAKTKRPYDCKLFQFLEAFSLMGDCKVNVPTTFPDLVAKSDSRLCKSRVRRFISRRIERLDWPCLGYRHHVATTVRRWNEAHNINMNGGCTVSAQFISFFDGSCSLVALVDRYKVFDKVFDMVSGEVDDVEMYVLI